MKNYFILEDGQQVGPLSVDELTSKHVNGSDLVWTQGMPDWQPAETVSELASAVAIQPPPAPPKPPTVTSTSPPPPPVAGVPLNTPPPPRPMASKTAPVYSPPMPSQAPPKANAFSTGYQPKPGGGWIIAGYIFAVLGGLIGFGIGIYLKMGKEKRSNGEKVLKFDESSQKHGLIISIIAIVSFVIWNSMGG